VRILPPFYFRFQVSAVIKHVQGFPALLAAPFANGVNALCWERALPGDFAEVVRLLGPGEGIVALDEERLGGMALSGKGKEAVKTMLGDLRLLREAGRDPVLNIIYGYPRDEEPAVPSEALAKEGTVIARDVFSFHADSAPVEADTWLCTYHGAPSEGLPNEDALRKVDDPATRAELLKLYGGNDDEVFAEWLAENCYDLHYAPRPGAHPYSFGRFNLWRIAVSWPDSEVPPCVHRAPATCAGQAARLLLIS
jgi:hypothetical protein